MLPDLVPSSRTKYCRVGPNLAAKFRPRTKYGCHIWSPGQNLDGIVFAMTHLKAMFSNYRACFSRPMFAKYRIRAFPRRCLLNIAWKLRTGGRYFHRCVTKIGVLTPTAPYSDRAYQSWDAADSREPKAMIDLAQRRSDIACSHT